MVVVKVIIRMNHGSNKSYLLNFEGRACKIAQTILQSNANQNSKIQKLMMFAGSRQEMDKQIRRENSFLAHYTISQSGYTAERLA